MVIIFDSQP